LGLGAVAAAASCKSPQPRERPDGVEPQRGLTLVAGGLGGHGSGDGTGADARFAFPTGAAVDQAGNVYVADQGNHLVRKVSPDGVVTTLAGGAGLAGNTDGTGADARFNAPSSVAVDSAGNVYVADRNNHTVRKITAGGVVTTLAAAGGMGAPVLFGVPAGVAVDAAGNVYVADRTQNTISEITTAGVVMRVGGAAATFRGPTGVAVDAAGTVYVAERDGCTISQITSAGVVSMLAGTVNTVGSSDGTGTGATFNYPTGVAVDRAGTVYVADLGSHTLRKITAGGVVTTIAGTARRFGRADGTGADARFRFPAGVAVDRAGNVYIADQANHTLRKATPEGVVTTLAGAAVSGGSADGTGTAARFSSPAGLAVDAAGDVYVADRYNQTIRRITPEGVVTTVAHSAGADGMASAARFDLPSGIAVDGAGNLYVAASASAVLSKVTPAGDVTTLASACNSSVDGSGTAVPFQFPADVAVDAAGTVYVADQLNATLCKVTAAGVATTLAGTAGMTGGADGTGAAARFTRPTGVALDRAGNLYVTDANAIRKITPAGEVTTLAGAAGTAGSDDGTGAAARFHQPTGIAVDSAGNVYVADQRNAAIRKITPDGTTTTLAGIPGAAGILLGETPRLAFPHGLAIAGDALVISDTDAILALRLDSR
jgi:sugar lactone lactonase YvrE